jgi:hypothetical protein
MQEPVTESSKNLLTKKERMFDTFLLLNCGQITTIGRGFVTD